MFNTFSKYVSIGFSHVIPLGFDHILFILCLFFMNTEWKAMFIQCSIFTVAHSISLALSASNIISYNSLYIEPVITMTIFFSALQNIVTAKMSKWRLGLVFLFGLIHGMGFASALKQNDIPENQFTSALVGFNVGVEIAQITIVLMAYWTFSKWFSQKAWYKKKIVYPASTIIACIALYWTILRFNGLSY